MGYHLALYRALMARWTRSPGLLVQPIARTTAAPITLSDTSERISPTRVRATLNAADSRACIAHT